MQATEEVAYVVGVGLDWGVDVAAGVLVLVGTGLAVRVAVAVASNVGVRVAVGVGVRVGKPAMTFALLQSVTSPPATSCPAEQPLFTHSPGSVTVTETASVEATVPLIETESATMSGLVDSRKVIDLPLNGRNFAQLIELQSGVSDGARL